MANQYLLSNLERQDQILDLVKRRERVTVTEISERFSVSPATVRRDLETLSERGVIQRFHGGARTAQQAPPELPVLQRQTEQSAEKRRIGQKAAALVADGETIFVSSGTTSLEVARNLHDRRNLTVITNSLLVVNVLRDAPGITLVGVGGVLRRSEMSLIGHLAEQALAEVHAHKVIMGIRALDIERGLTNDYLPETMTDRAILKTGREVIIVADHTKCGRVSTALVAPLTVMHTLVTDDKTPPGFVNALTGRGIRVLIA